MNREDAEEIVFDLIDAVRNYERADSFQVRMTRREMDGQRERVIEALMNVKQTAQ